MELYPPRFTLELVAQVPLYGFIISSYRNLDHKNMAGNRATTSHDGPPPNPSITLGPLPPEFDDIPKENLQCYNSWASAAAINLYIQWQIFTLAPWVPLPTPTPHTTIYPVTNTECTTTYSGPQTVLCDNITRNYLPTENTTCATTSFLSTYSLYNSYWQSSPSWLSSWSTANTKPYPPCTFAHDFETVCYRLHSVYSWRTSQAAASASANITTTPEDMLWPMKPTCKTLIDLPSPNAKTKRCKFDVDDYAIYYWPSAPLIGTTFCANATRRAGGTRTIPWLPNTAVVSGHTLTSPSVYHFLTGVRVSTYLGNRDSNKFRSPHYNISSALPTSLITFPQGESEIWTAQPTEFGIGASHHTEWRYANSSYNADWMATAPSSAYFNACSRNNLCSSTDRTISQAHFRQFAALSVKDVLAEWDSGKFLDCDWTSQYFESWGSGNWHDRKDMWIAPGEPWRATPIVTEEGEVKATGVGWARPGSVAGGKVSRTQVSGPEQTGKGGGAE
ncbi:uncharacterized protein BDR25DRAFT_343567 [Lindgomyces ingoldianus]|uniref:Uncharacterized protein n=1 Tax=Lindgomyces ingoldianus TaxID=673940 RepID=A0ACB6QV33_9PLEO|nr:uncharacterized protein BDR25DRAFT_343567 [Lindgomyces ingoldianus]KAF2469925.1 hypothetical protein BDR25DRAFT_343567 [Lindgomyces ingoldianus]